MALAIGMSLVDSYRRRGKKSKPFPVTPPREVAVGDGTVTPYTFGQDLYDAMLAAIDGAQRQILFETYIWKGDEVGERVQGGARRRRRPRRRGLLHLRRLRQPRRLAAVQALPARAEGAALPGLHRRLRFFDLRRYGRDHRKILVVDDEVGFVGGYNIGTAYATEWRDTHVRITGPGVWDLSAPSPTSGTSTADARIGRSERPLLLETASDWEPRIRFHRNVPRLWMFPIRSMYLEAINRATAHIWMTHAYFIPDQDFVDAMKSTPRGAASTYGCCCR